MSPVRGRMLVQDDLDRAFALRVVDIGRAADIPFEQQVQTLAAT